MAVQVATGRLPQPHSAKRLARPLRVVRNIAQAVTRCLESFVLRQATVNCHRHESKSQPRQRSCFCRAAETAEILNLTTGRLAKWRLYGGGPEFVRLGRRIFYRKEILEQFIDRKTYQHTSAYGKRSG
jgi:hypothetical protein